MAYLTDLQVRQKVADMLGVSVDAVPAKYATLITQANSDAQAEIKGRLKARGYTVAQIATWSRLAEFNGDIACFWVFTRAAALNDAVMERLASLDRRDELDDVWLLDSDGEDIDPGADSGGRIARGTLTTTNDLFRLDPDDGRRGQATQF